ncbi:MAG: hypothetical protein ACOCZ6_05295 [Nanoarchaeota archaeon]
MGFSTIGSFIVMFFGFLILLSSVFMIFGAMVDNTISLSAQEKEEEKRAQTSINIINITVDREQEPDLTTFQIINDGSRKLDKNDLDVYINGDRIPRDSENRTTYFKEENKINPLHWDPGEIMIINITKELEEGKQQGIVATEFGITDSSVFK